jgi:hypothetical protein
MENSSIEGGVPPTEGAVEAVEKNDSQALFSGDCGQLRLETRRTLVQLLLGPSVDARRQSKLWPILLRDEAVLRSRLHELFLELVVDHEQQVAFTRQVVAEDLDAPVLLRKANLTFLESALLLFLRQRLTQADTQGERAVISTQEMAEHLAVFERHQNTDHAKFERQVAGAMEKAKKLSLIRQLGNADKRFEVAPTLKLLFPAEEIQILTRTYAELAEGKAQQSENAGDGESDPDADGEEEI